MGRRCLVCSVCGANKKCGKKRYEKFKDTEYVCRDCRKKAKEEPQELTQEE